MVNFFETKTPTSLIEIEKIEQMVGLNFPVEYKEHLLRHNGGRCKPDIFYFENKINGRNEDSLVGRFLAVYDGPYSNLKHYMECFKLDEKRLPSYMVPIANDPLGNLICLSCGEQDYGHIYFWDHEQESGEIDLDDSKFENLYHVSNSLTSFLEGLQDESLLE